MFSLDSYSQYLTKAFSAKGRPFMHEGLWHLEPHRYAGGLINEGQTIHWVIRWEGVPMFDFNKDNDWYTGFGICCMSRSIKFVHHDANYRFKAYQMLANHLTAQMISFETTMTPNQITVDFDAPIDEVLEAFNGLTY